MGLVYDSYAFRANLPPLCSKCTPVAHERVEEATSQNRRSSPRTSPRTSEQNILDALAFGRVCGLCMTRSILARPVPFPSEACLPGRVGAARTAPRGAGSRGGIRTPEGGSKRPRFVRDAHHPRKTRTVSERSVPPRTRRSGPDGATRRPSCFVCALWCLPVYDDHDDVCVIV